MTTPDTTDYFVGYRGWFLDSKTVFSPSFRDVYWPKDGPLRATCHDPFLWMWRSGYGRDQRMNPDAWRHAVPHQYCTCGIYAVTVPWHSIAPEGPHGVEGLVKAWGRVVTATEGFRAEYAQPLAFFHDSSAWFFRRAGQRHLQVLAEAYGVPLIPKSLILKLSPAGFLESVRKNIRETGKLDPSSLLHQHKKVHGW